MKHGPIALIEPEFPTFALAFNDALFPKVKSNIVEVQARRGPVIALANPGADLHVEHLWTIPSAWGPFNAFLRFRPCSCSAMKWPTISAKTWISPETSPRA